MEGVDLYNFTPKVDTTRSSMSDARLPTPVAVLSTAALSVAAHSCLDAIPPSVITAILKRFGARNSDGFDLRMWLHSLVLGVGAGYSFLQDQSSEFAEPNSSFSCLPPSSTLSWALPAAELGYAMHDLRDALRLGNKSFILHGFFVGGFLALLFALGVAHHVTVVLSTHTSSIFLNLRRVDFGPRANAAIDVLFALSFCIMRLVLLPALWIVFLRHARDSDYRSWGACMLGERVVHIAIAGGFVMHGLNAYWGWQIVMRLRARLSWRDADGLGRSSGAEGHYHKSRRR